MSQFFGKYRGVVNDIIDPMNRGRIRALVPDVLGDQASGWALPCFPFGGSQSGFFALPAPGSLVWIEFEQGNPDLPIWSGTFLGSPADSPPEWLAPPYKKVMLRTASGHQIVLDDTPGVGGVTLQTATGAKLVLDGSGIEIDNGMGAKISMKLNKVTINDTALEVT